MDDLEKMRRAKAMLLARRQEEADRAKMRRDGVPAKPGTIETTLHPQNPNRLKINDNN